MHEPRPLPLTLVVLGALCLATAGVPARAGEKRTTVPPKATFCGSGFTSYADMVAALDDYAAAHPDLCRVETIGTSVRGRAIVGLRISDHVATDEMEPEARIIGAIHGNECMAYEVALGIIQALLDGYGTDPVATAIVDGVETLVVPMANPDGSAASTRANADGVDLNRNFPFMWTTSASEGTPGSEPETRALIADGLLHPYVLGLSYHTAADFVNLVWNYTPVAPRHEPELDALLNPYAVGTTYRVTLGWHWYSVYGEYTDHNYGTRGTLDTIIEIQSDTGITTQRNLHVPRALALLAHADDGLAGRVTDAVSGAPLVASVWVAERRAPVFTAPGLGDFHEVLLPGSYDVTVTAPLHRPLHVGTVTVPSTGHAWIDAALEPADESYGFAVVSTIISQEITDARYPNDSVPSDALGPPDGSAFGLEPYGEIVVDMGVDVADHEGADLRIHAGTGATTDTAEVEGSHDRAGPWSALGSVTGTGDLDLAASGLGTLRYVQITDTTGGRFGARGAGYDLDSVEVLFPAGADADADADADSSADADAEADAGADADADSSADADVEADARADADGGTDTDSSADVADAVDADAGGGASGCGCDVAGAPPAGGAPAIVVVLALLLTLRAAKTR